MASSATLQKLVTKEDCEKILRRSLNQPATFHSYKIISFHEGVAGFLGDHFKLSIKFSIDGTQSQKSYFMKTVPQFNTNQLDYVQDSGIFKKEVLLYKNLLSELLKINQFGPRCYFIKDDCIVLEDLCSKGFRMSCKDSYLNETSIISVLKTLAKFHASTLIYEDKWGTKLDKKFPEEVKETCFSFIEGQPRQRWCVSTTKCVIDLIKLMHKLENCEKICEKIHKFVFEKLPKFLQPSDRFTNVLTHDDLWCNNMLYNDQLEYLFVDFQLVRYTPPAYDLILTLLLNLETEYFKTNFKRLTDIYYAFLEEELKKHGLNVDDVIPKREFNESLECYMLPALIEAAMYGSHVFVSQELHDYVVADIDKYNEFSFINRSKYVVKEFVENPQFRDRIYGILRLLVNVVESYDL